MTEAHLISAEAARVRYLRRAGRRIEAREAAFNGRRMIGAILLRRVQA